MNRKIEPFKIFKGIAKSS